MENVSSRYALALYSLAMDLNKVESWQQEVKELKSIFNENTDFVMILGSSFLPINERQEIMNKTLKGVDENIKALISVIMENNRTDLIIDVFDVFNTYCNEYRGIREGYIYSTLKLDEKVISKIEKKISKSENNKVELKNVIDPSLIGGVKIVVHDHIYDGSIKHHLEMMKKDLLK